MPECIKCKKDVPHGASYCPWCGIAQVDTPKKQGRKKRGNGTGTAIKRGKTWTARVVLGYTMDSSGKARAKYATKGGFRSKNEALAYCPSLLHMRPESSPNLMHYWDVYSNNDMAKLSASKQDAYRIAWNKLSSIHYVKVDNLDVATLIQVTAKVAPTYYPARDIKVLLTHLYKLAAADGYANKDLPSFITLPKLEEAKREPFSPDEQKALWNAYERGVPHTEYILLMIYTGMMPGEVLNMTTDMIDLDAKTIRGAGKKTAVRKAAPIIIPDCVIPILSAMIDNTSGKIFKAHEKNFYALYYDALSAAGVRKLPPYSCRHTTATALAITENIAPQTVQKIMRWSSTRMLDRYAHPDITDAKTAINSLKK